MHDCAICTHSDLKHLLRCLHFVYILYSMTNNLDIIIAITKFIWYSNHMLVKPQQCHIRHYILYALYPHGLLSLLEVWIKFFFLLSFFQNGIPEEKLINLSPGGKRSGNTTTHQPTTDRQTTQRQKFTAKKKKKKKNSSANQLTDSD